MVIYMLRKQWQPAKCINCQKNYNTANRKLVNDNSGGSIYAISNVFI